MKRAFCEELGSERRGEVMIAAPLTDADVKKAEAYWADYQKTHDVSMHHGQVAGIDPIAGRVWFGESAGDITEQMDAQGAFAPFYCVRVGHDHYLRKGRR